jgi:drug/metabolite transporter (DMT)-like permease
MMSETMSPYLRGFLITLFGVLVISPDTLLIRLIEADHWAQLFWRGTLSGLAVLLGIAVVTRGRGLRPLLRPTRADLLMAVVYGSGNIAFVYSATHTLVANTLFLLSTSPVFAALIARFVLKEAVGLRTVLTIAATIVGIAVIASGSLGGGGGTIEGDLAALWAAIALAVTFSIARRQKGRSMVPAMGAGAILAGLSAGALAPTVMIPEGDRIWMGLMGLWVVPVAFACLTTGPRYLPAADVGLLMLLEAVFGPLLVWWVLGEDPGPRTLLGGAIVLGAMVVSNLWLLARGQRDRRLARRT